MPQGRVPYDPEFRRRIIELNRGGRSVASLAKEYGPTEQSIRNWVRQADRDDGIRKDGLTTQERSELTRLRRENAVLREERDILKKAAAWFAQETAMTPRGRSNS
jgi:transposase